MLKNLNDAILMFITFYKYSKNKFVTLDSSCNSNENLLCC